MAEGVRAGRTDDGEFAGAVEELHNALLARLLHYQAVLLREGMDLPYVWLVASNPVTLTPAAEP